MQSSSGWKMTIWNKLFVFIFCLFVFIFCFLLYVGSYQKCLWSAGKGFFQNFTLNVDTSESPLKTKVSNNVSGVYVVLSAGFHEDKDLSYVFDLPITVRVWKQLGIRSFVILIGSEEQWKKGSVSVALDELRQLDPVIRFLDVEPKHAILLSQVSRNFAPCLFPDKHNLKDSDAFVTSDADLWPIGKKFYEKMIRSVDDIKSAVTSTDAYWNGYFDHKGKKIQMHHMIHLIAKSKTWSMLGNVNVPSCRQNPLKYMLGKIAGELGEKILAKESSKLNNLDAWYIDQKLVSIWIDELRKKGKISLNMVIRPGVRIDRANWVVPKSLDKINDAHTFDKEAYGNVKWSKMLKLLKKMFNVKTVDHLGNYRKDFVEKLSHPKN